jgi:hypothetical protein
MKSHLSFLTKHSEWHDIAKHTHLASLISFAGKTTDRAQIQAKCAQYLTISMYQNWTDVRMIARFVLFERTFDRFPLEHANALNAETLAAFVADIASLLPKQAGPREEEAGQLNAAPIQQQASAGRRRRGRAEEADQPNAAADRAPSPPQRRHRPEEAQEQRQSIAIKKEQEQK